MSLDLLMLLADVTTVKQIQTISYRHRLPSIVVERENDLTKRFEVQCESFNIIRYLKCLSP